MFSKFVWPTIFLGGMKILKRYLNLDIHTHTHIFTNAVSVIACILWGAGMGGGGWVGFGVGVRLGACMMDTEVDQSPF